MIGHIVQPNLVKVTTHGRGNILRGLYHDPDPRGRALEGQIFVTTHAHAVDLNEWRRAICS